VVLAIVVLLGLLALLLPLPVKDQGRDSAPSVAQDGTEGTVHDMRGSGHAVGLHGRSELPAAAPADETEASREAGTPRPLTIEEREHRGIGLMGYKLHWPAAPPKFGSGERRIVCSDVEPRAPFLVSVIATRRVYRWDAPKPIPVPELIFARRGQRRMDPDIRVEPLDVKRIAATHWERGIDCAEQRIEASFSVRLFGALDGARSFDIIVLARGQEVLREIGNVFVPPLDGISLWNTPEENSGEIRVSIEAMQISIVKVVVVLESADGVSIPVYSARVMVDGKRVRPSKATPLVLRSKDVVTPKSAILDIAYDTTQAPVTIRVLMTTPEGHVIEGRHVYP